MVVESVPTSLEFIGKQINTESVEMPFELIGK